MRLVVLDGFTTDQGDPEAWDALRSLGDLRVFPRTLPEQAAERCADAEIVFTNKVFLNDQNLGAGVRYIGVLATGVNVVDLEAARRRNIAVTNVPGYSTESVAQLAFALLLHLTHDVAGHGAAAKAGKWAASPDFTFQTQTLSELNGKTLAVLGSGAIGSAVSRIAVSFGMRVLAARLPGSPRTAGRVPLPEALPQADVVTLHCPLTEGTRDLVDRNFLAALKPTAILINTARGGLVREADLVEALDQGRLGGVALDVLAREPPPPDHPLLNPGAPWARKVVVTPHLGWATAEARRRLVSSVAENLRAFSRGESLNRVA